MKHKFIRCLTTVATVAVLTTSMYIESSAASKPKLNKTNVTLTAGKTTTLKVKNLSKKVKVTWKTSKKSVATVTSKGKVTAKKRGVAFVKATFKYKKGSKNVSKTLKCKVTVKSKKVQATKKPTPTTWVPTSTPTVAPTATAIPTATAVPTVEPTATEVPTATPTAIPTATATPIPTATATPTPTLPKCKTAGYYVGISENIFTYYTEKEIEYCKNAYYSGYSGYFWCAELKKELVALSDEQIESAEFYPNGCHGILFDYLDTESAVDFDYDTPGYKRWYCSLCKETVREEITPNNCYTGKLTENGIESVNIPNPHDLRIYFGENAIISPDNPSHVHNYNAKYEVVKESTCTEDGLINLYCECGKVYQRVISASHRNLTFSDSTVVHPTETTDGYFGFHCETCGMDVTHSELTTFPALTDENYSLEGWVYEKHDYDYNSFFYKYNHKVDETHENPYIVVSDYIGTAEHPALKDKYTIDGVEYEVEIQGELRVSSPTVQSLRLYITTWVNPSQEIITAKYIPTYTTGGSMLIK